MVEEALSFELLVFKSIVIIGVFSRGIQGLCVMIGKFRRGFKGLRVSFVISRGRSRGRGRGRGSSRSGGNGRIEGGGLRIEDSMKPHRFVALKQA